MNFFDKIGASKNNKQTYPRFLVFGGPGTGKSTFALSFPDPFVADLERGASALRTVGAFDRKTGRPIGWAAQPGSYYSKEYTDPAEFLVDIRKMYADGILNGGIKTLVIDTITMFDKMINLEYRSYSGKVNTNSENIDSIFTEDDLTFRDNLNLKGPKDELLQYILKSKVILVEIAHAGVRIVEEKRTGRNGRQYSKMNFVGKKAKGANAHDVDIVLEMLDETDPLFKKFDKAGSLAIVHKDRFQVFRQGDIVPDPRYDLWKEALEHPDEFREHKLSTLGIPTHNKPNVKLMVEEAMRNQILVDLAEEVGVDKQRLQKVLLKYNGDSEIVMQKLKGMKNDNL